MADAINSPQLELPFADSNGAFAVQSAVGHKLSCVISQPEHSKMTEEGEVAILCHGLFCSKNHHLLLHLAANLPLATVRFDFHGNGQSGGDEDWNFGGYQTEVDQDIRSVVLFLRSKQLKVVALIGHSRGANNALLYAIRYDDIPLVVAIASRYDMARGIDKHFGEARMKLLEPGGPGSFEIVASDGRTRRITQSSIDDRLAIDMSRVSLIRHSKLLLVHGTADDIIPFQDSERLRDNVVEAATAVATTTAATTTAATTTAAATATIATTRATLLPIDGAGHLFLSQKEKVALTAGIHDWLTRNHQQQQQHQQQHQQQQQQHQ
eukprot:GHVS01075215.1.p1 GENE.GHVS01075215.1~~GHVS01075215.1.p1  ORF type:complete len:357 (-),score=130.58 GHVS01075215.1:76-1044(-)